MAIKRTTLPRWATDDVINSTSGLNNVTEPSEAKKDLGWDFLEKPARQYFNWIGRQTNQWLEYFDEEVNVFAGYETEPPTMSITLNKGHLNIGTNVLHIAIQTSPLLTAPLTNPRIDRVVISETTGLAAIVQGVESASPVIPTFLTSQIPVAYITLYVGITEIVNADITDERSRSPFTGTITSSLFLQEIASDGIGLYSQNQTTGLTATDGFYSGIDANENALLWNYENTDLLFATNNIERGKISSFGSWLINPDGNPISPLNHLVVYNSLVGGECYAQFINDGTGVGEFNGFVVGIDTVERANVWNYENTDLVFATNSTFRAKISFDGDFLITPSGIDIDPQRQLVIYDGAVAGDPFLQFINDTTGVTGSDGFIVGINADNSVALWNFENTDIRFATSNTARAKFDANGYFLLSHDGNDVTPQHHLVIYGGAGGSNSYAQFINDATGAGVNSGFRVGINAIEQAELWNVHNSDLRFATNNFFRGKISNNGFWCFSANNFDFTPNNEIVVYRHSSTDGCYSQFVNAATGTAQGAGFLVGINASEQAELWNYENTNMRFGTNNLERMQIESDGSVEIGSGLANQGAGTLNALNGLYVNNVPVALTPFRGALVRYTVSQNIPYFTNTILIFNAEEYDTDSIHDNSVNNSRLTVPSGVSKVRLSACIEFLNTSDYSEITLSIIKSGNPLLTFVGRPQQTVLGITGGLTTPRLNVISAVVSVVSGNFFEVQLFQANVGSSSRGLNSSFTWFSMEIIE